MQKKYHYIYKTTCKVTGKFYVGMHSTNNLDDGYLGSGKILGYSRHKYGDENHVKEIVEFLPSRDALKLREKEIVNEELLKDPYCMNLTSGGTGGNIGGGGFFGDEHRKNFHAAGGKTTARKRADPAFNSAINEKISIGQKAYLARNPSARVESQKLATEAAHSETANAKRRATNAARGYQQGKNNNQFGKVWVTNGLMRVSIKKEKLDEYLVMGYYRGMGKRKSKESSKSRAL